MKNKYQKNEKVCSKLEKYFLTLDAKYPNDVSKNYPNEDMVDEEKVISNCLKMLEPSVTAVDPREVCWKDRRVYIYDVIKSHKLMSVKMWLELSEKAAQSLNDESAKRAHKNIDTDMSM